MQAPDLVLAVPHVMANPTISLLKEKGIEVYAKEPLLGRRMILSSVIAWYLVDTTGSLIVDAWMNAILNTAFLAALIAPVLKPATASNAQTA